MGYKGYKKLISCVMLCSVFVADAQFNTVRREKPPVSREPVLTELEESLYCNTPYVTESPVDSLRQLEMIPERALPDFIGRRSSRAVPRLDISSCNPEDMENLPGLSIPNLIAEIRRNGIKHERIVLAQAILETGWFTSNVCRTKNNLFGLTNPRTGRYYEFRHWTESVRAYYTKVQYRYRGGNYLTWLREIGYAEDPRYISSLIRILRQYFL